MRKYESHDVSTGASPHGGGGRRPSARCGDTIQITMQDTIQATIQMTIQNTVQLAIQSTIQCTIRIPGASGVLGAFSLVSLVSLASCLHLHGSQRSTAEVSSRAAMCPVRIKKFICPWDRGFVHAFTPRQVSLDRVRDAK